MSKYFSSVAHDPASGKLPRKITIRGKPGVGGVCVCVSHLNTLSTTVKDSEEMGEYFVSSSSVQQHITESSHARTQREREREKKYKSVQLAVRLSEKLT